MKEKYYVSPQPTTTTFISGESITINSTKPNKLAEDIFVTGTSIEKYLPTLSECIKEWEKEGYVCKKTDNHFFIEEVDGNIIAIFNLLYGHLTTTMWLNSKRLNLLDKTFKALEVK